MKWLVVLCACLFVYLVAGAGEGRDFDRSHYRGISTSKFSHKDNVNIKDKAFVKNFILMPYEIKRMILSYLTENELYAFMKIQEVADFHPMAVEAYGVSYGNTPVYVKDRHLDANIDFVYKDRALSFNNVTIFKDFLKTFHKYVKNLKLDFIGLHQSGELRDVLTVIGKYSAETLKRLEIRDDQKIVNGIEIVRKMSFPNVVELSFFMCEFTSHNLNLRNAFPSVRRLAATLTSFTDRMWVDKSFSNLTHLQINTKQRLYFTESEVLRILSNNPQIHSLSLVQSTPSFLSTINERFPNIINLGIINLPPVWRNNQVDVHMKNVERLVFEGAIPMENPHFLSFDNIKEIQWHSPSDADVLLTKLIQNNKQSLEILQIVESKINDAHLKKLIDLPALKKVGIWNAKFTAKALINFIESNKKLSEIRLYNAPESLKKDLYDALNSNEVSTSLKSFEPQSNEEGDFYLRKRDGNQIKWGNTLEFLWDNFF